MRFRNSNYMLRDVIDNLNIAYETTGDVPVVVSLNGREYEIDDIMSDNSICRISI